MRMHSVRGIATGYGLIFAALVAGTGVAVYFGTEIALNNMIDARLERATQRVVGAERPVDVAAVAARVRQRERARSITDTGYVLIDASGRRLAGRIKFGPTPFGYSDIRFADGSPRRHGGRALLTPLGGGAWLGAIAENESAEDFQNLFTRVLLIALAAAVAAGISGGWALSTTIGRRMRGMQSTAEAIIAGDLTRRMPIDGSGSEFDRQAVTLNTMLDRIGELLANLQQVSSDLAHDLRTPLSRLSNHLETALAGDEATLRQNVGDAIVQADEILGLFGALLRISEIEAGKRRARFAPLDLDPLVGDVIETFAPAIEDEGRSLTFDTTDGVLLRGDRELLTQMVINLVENAARHTPAGTAVRVSIGRADGRVTLDVADNGPGIPAADHEMVLRRFTRREASRSTAGHGLGLALVSAIARLHDGTVELADNHPGLIVRVILPAPEQPTPVAGDAAAPHLPVHPHPREREEEQRES
jgi:signal transduction histidine kinase